MNKLIFAGGCTACFVAGLVTGGFITKKKMISAQEEEIETIRQFYGEKIKELKREETTKEAAKMVEKGVSIQDIARASDPLVKSNPDLKEAAMKVLKDEAKKIIKDEGYYSSDPDRGPLDEDDPDDEDDDEDPEPILEKVRKNEERDRFTPHVISPAECGECDYEVIELTYYADKVLVDDYDDVIDDPEDIVGPKALSSFGEYEEDTVYVRNDERRIDYCIVKDYRNYSSLPESQRR